MTNISLCDIDQAGIFSGKDVFLYLGAEIKQVYDLVQAEKADAGPARDLLEVLGPAIGQHPLDLVSEEELLPDQRLVGERNARRVGQPFLQLIEREVEFVFFKRAVQFNPELAFVPIVFDPFDELFQDRRLLIEGERCPGFIRQPIVFGQPGHKIQAF